MAQLCIIQSSSQHVCSCSHSMLLCTCKDRCTTDTQKHSTHMHVNADRHTHACTEKHTDAWPHHVAHRLIMWAGALGDSISVFVTSEVWVWLWWPRSYHPAACSTARPPPALPSSRSSVSVLQTDFEKDVDLACRSGERLTGESHGGQSALLLLSLLLASVCFTCPHPTPTAAWPSLGPLLLKGFRRPVCVTEEAPESCCGAGLGPSLVPLHVPVCLSLLLSWDPALPILCLVHSLSPASCLSSPKHPCYVLSLFLCC